jgi:small multidrug resistance family-3 protein
MPSPLSTPWSGRRRERAPALEVVERPPPGRQEGIPRHVLSTGQPGGVSVARAVALFIVAAVAEIGGAWLIWQGVREHRGVAWIGAGIAALAAYGFVATLQHDNNFGRILAAYGGIFVAGSLAWGIVMDGFKPDRYDYLGASICLIGVAVIMFAPRPA